MLPGALGVPCAGIAGPDDRERRSRHSHTGGVELIIGTNPRPRFLETPRRPLPTLRARRLTRDGANDKILALMDRLDTSSDGRKIEVVVGSRMKAVAILEPERRRTARPGHA